MVFKKLLIVRSTCSLISPFRCMLSPTVGHITLELLSSFKPGTTAFWCQQRMCLENTSSHDPYFYVAPNEIRYVTGKRIWSRSSEIDIGVVQLEKGFHPPYPEVKNFSLDISYLQSNCQRENKHFAFIGFPATKSNVRTKDRSIVVQPYSYRSDSIPESDYDRHGLSPRTHLALPLDLRKGFDREAKQVHFPRPQGMSGSPVFILYEDKDCGSHAFPVVAVAIEYRRREKIVVATDVQYVVEAISHAT